MNSVAAVILAAGKGTRMRSSLPKVLHPVCGPSMLEHITTSVREAGIEDIILVVGHKADQVKEAMGEDFIYCLQEPQLGTGHALMLALPMVPPEAEKVLVLSGDTPLLQPESIRQLYEEFEPSGADCLLLTATLDDATSYGRIVRNVTNQVEKIVEDKDATAEEKSIKEINTGCYCFKVSALQEAVAHLNNDNAQGEYYLTDTIGYLKDRGSRVAALKTKNSQEIMGVNNLIALSEVTSIVREKTNKDFLLAGVNIIDHNNTYIDTTVKIGIGTIIEPGCYLRGNTVIGEHCYLGPNCDLKDATIGDWTKINRSQIVESELGEHCNVGPFAYIRPGSVISDNVKIGDFVEIKNSEINEGSKVPHLTYVGDSEIGVNTNIGCGTVTCNYDGYEKHKTIIGDGVFIGSNANLVAPVKIESGAVVAAGSTIIENVPADSIGMARSEQENIINAAKSRREKRSKNNK